MYEENNAYQTKQQISMTANDEYLKCYPWLPFNELFKTRTIKCPNNLEKNCYIKHIKHKNNENVIFSKQVKEKHSNW